MRSATTILNDKCTVDQNSLSYLILFNFLCYSPQAVIDHSSALCAIALGGDLPLFWTSSSHTRGTHNTLRKESSPLPVVTAFACCSGCANPEDPTWHKIHLSCGDCGNSGSVFIWAGGGRMGIYEKKLPFLSCPLFVLSILSFAKILVLCNDRDFSVLKHKPLPLD